jgi:hypothetical protein
MWALWLRQNVSMRLQPRDMMGRLRYALAHGTSARLQGPQYAAVSSRDLHLYLYPRPSTVGRAVAAVAGCAFVDADGFHPESNLEKMRAGVPLTDEDRWPWLLALRSELLQRAARWDQLCVCRAERHHLSLQRGRKLSVGVWCVTGQLPHTHDGPSGSPHSCAPRRCVQPQGIT